MVITGSKQEWSARTSQDMSKSSEYIVKGALEQKVIDTLNELHHYEEDNIWLFYKQGLYIIEKKFQICREPTDISCQAIPKPVRIDQPANFYEVPPLNNPP